jgi:uracil-DNA glycosylase
MFTGDQSGDVLFAALHAVGLASQPTATSIDDGMQLFGVRMLAPVHCAPPDNKPTPTERDTCRAWLVRELQLLQPHLRSIVVLGHFGWQALLPALSQAGWLIDSPRPKFGHGAHITLRPAETAPSTSGGTPGATSGLATPDELHLFGCYHVSQHNTFTGRLTPSMVEEVLSRAAKSASDQPGSS